MGPVGHDPTSLGLKARYSAHLSYGPVWHRDRYVYASWPSSFLGSLVALSLSLGSIEAGTTPLTTGTPVSISVVLSRRYRDSNPDLRLPCYRYTTSRSRTGPDPSTGDVRPLHHTNVSFLIIPMQLAVTVGAKHDTLLDLLEDRGLAQSLPYHSADALFLLP